MMVLKLSYSRAALDWSEGLPIGNGRLGAVICSGMDSETWHMTEVTYWSGKPELTSSRAKGKVELNRMREHFFAGDYKRGEHLAEQVLQSKKGNFGTNLSLCDLKLEFDHQGEDFIRELNLDKAVVHSSYQTNGGVFNREVIASYVDGVLASRLWSGQKKGVSFKLQIIGSTNAFRARLEDSNTIVFSGTATEQMHSDGVCGVSCQGMVKVVALSGMVYTEAGQIVVKDADEALIYFAANTNYGQTDGEWASASGKQLELVMAKGYPLFREDHISDYRSLYARVNIDLGLSSRTCVPTDERIRLLMNGQDNDPELFALFFQYGRYLTISGSRANSPLPMHLQGIWNDGEANRMAWSCDYHLDINTEMNYYLTESANLAECHLPLLSFIERLSAAGSSTALNLYGCKGWVAHVFTNAWGFTAPGWHYSWGLHVTGGLWIATHLREHYEFNLDPGFLKERAYPVLKEAAVFFLDYMIIHPKYGWLVTGPSTSPENSFFLLGDRENSIHHLSMGSTLDQVLVRDLFVFCLESASQLQVDHELQQSLKQAIALLPPLQVGAGGQLQEWLEDYREAQPDHRHLSHLYSLYPGKQVTPEGTPELSAAARKTLESRMTSNSLEDVEFTIAAFAASFARLRDGENALKQLTYLVGHLCFDNLLTYSKPGIAGAETNIFVADGNFGGAAAIAEMLLQSHAGKIDLLPALPEKWQTGKVTGLRAKGNAEVDLVWENGRLVEATIKAFAAGQTYLRYLDRTVRFDMEAGGVYTIKEMLDITRQKREKSDLQGY